MDLSTLDQYYELALDLPERARERLLAELDREDPGIARQLREMLADPRGCADFACRSAASSQPSGARPGPVLDRLHHVALQVRDVGQAVAWYRSVFACEVDHADASWALLRFADLKLALVLPGEHPPHVALVRPDARKFGPLTEHRDGTRSAYIVDPWGNSLEILDAGSLSD